MSGAVRDIDPDLLVLERVADGDVEAFAELVDRHRDRLVRLCHRMLGDREEARDAAQDVLVKVFRHAGRFRPRGKVSTWLHSIAVNHCLNRLRRRKIVRFFGFEDFGDGGDEESGPVFDPADDAPDPGRRAESRDRWRRTRRHIDALPVNQRAVVVLAKLEGLSYKEVAQTLGVTVGAVESRLFRAMRRLETLAQEESPE
ncbi:MAG: RNA polymerase sigma factor [Acidobacteriota bacterium]